MANFFRDKIKFEVEKENPSEFNFLSLLMTESTKKPFRVVKIPKRNGKFRYIYIPNDEYKASLKQLNDKFNDLLVLNINDIKDHAFISGRNCVTNACAHIGNRFILSLDIENFFESIKWKHIKFYIAHEFKNIVCIDGELKQGLPTSPLLSNIGFIQVEKEILSLLDNILDDVKYTRYADDLIFSFNDIKLTKTLTTHIELILMSHGFSINKKKTRLQDIRNGRAIITGVAIDDCFVYPTRKTLKKIRASLHQNNEKSTKGLIEWAKCKFPNIR